MKFLILIGILYMAYRVFFASPSIDKAAHNDSIEAEDIDYEEIK